MRRYFVAVLVVACVVGSTAGFARESASGFARQSVPIFAEPLPQMPESQIPTPLPPPAQAPVINGPVSQPHGPSALR
jgi:hypothetical protein